jgi:ankyrin repeat protein
MSEGGRLPIPTSALESVLEQLTPSSNDGAQEAEKTLTEADKKLLKAAGHKEHGGGKLQEAKGALNEGARVDAADEWGRIPLHIAAYNGHKEIVEMLIEKAADAGAVDKYLGTPLHYAAKGGHMEIAEMLIEKGANVSAATKDGWTPLCWAANNGHREIKDMVFGSIGQKEVAEMLIKRGADVNAKVKYGSTPLHMAANCGHKEIGDMLIENLADVDAKDEDGETPLHWAAQQGHKEIAEVLIEKMADVDAANKDGETPLHRVAREGKKEMVQMLVDGEADVDAVDNKGKSPLDVSWEKDPSSPLTLLLLLKSKIGIESMTYRHLVARLGAQLGKLIKDRDEGNKEDRQWLGTGARTTGDLIGEDGLWVKGGDTVVRLLVQILRRGQSLLVVPLFEKLLVPSTTDEGLHMSDHIRRGAGRRGNNMMDHIRVATVDSETKMLTYAAAEDWPDTNGYLHAKRFRRLDQDDRDAVPVKGFVFALKGFLSDQRLLQAIGDYSGGMKLFETDSVRCLEQHLWQAWGKTEFMLRLTETVGHTICVLLFCYWLAEETELVHYEKSCPGELPCYSTSTAATLSEQSLWMVVLGGVVAVWSVRYLLEQAGDVIMLYMGARREQKRARWVAFFERQEHTTAMVEHMDGLLERHTFKALKAAVVTRESTIAFLQEKEEALLDKVFDTEITRETLVAFYEKHDPENEPENKCYLNNVDYYLEQMSTKYATVAQIKVIFQEKYGAAPESTVIPRAEGGGNTVATDEKEAEEAAAAPHLRDCARAAMEAANGQFQWDDLVANTLTLVVVGMAWSGTTLNLNLVCAMTVFALFVRLSDLLAGVPSVGFWISLFISTVQDALPVFMLLMLLVFGFALIFRILMPNEPAFADLKTAVLSAYYTMMLSHENDYYPPVASVQAVLIVYTFVSAIIMLNIFIAQIGDTYSREKASRKERRVRKRLQLLARMRRSPVHAVVGWWVAKCKRSAGGEDDTKPGYMIVLKAVGASDGENEDGERHLELMQQNAELKQQIVDMKQRMEQQAQQLGAILAAVNPSRRK